MTQKLSYGLHSSTDHSFSCFLILLVSVLNPWPCAWKDWALSQPFLLCLFQGKKIWSLYYLMKLGLEWLLLMKLDQVQKVSKQTVWCWKQFWRHQMRRESSSDFSLCWGFLSRDDTKDLIQMRGNSAGSASQWYSAHLARKKHWVWSPVLQSVNWSINLKNEKSQMKSQSSMLHKKWVYSFKIHTQGREPLLTTLML